MNTTLTRPDSQTALQLAEQLESPVYSKCIATSSDSGKFHAAILACRSARLEARGRAHISNHDDCELIGRLSLLLEKILLQSIT